jgi:hypothetical protein
MKWILFTAILLLVNGRISGDELVSFFKYFFLYTCMYISVKVVNVYAVYMIESLLL